MDDPNGQLTGCFRSPTSNGERAMRRLGPVVAAAEELGTAHGIPAIGPLIKILHDVEEGAALVSWEVWL